MSKPQLLSLFTGYGGLDMAVNNVFSSETAYVSDVSSGACKVLAHRMPDIPNLGDITKIDWSTLNPVDIICGGSPCQDMSTGGKRAGMLKGTRSGLWSYMLEGISIVRPKFVIWENVRGALTAKAYSKMDETTGHVGDNLRAIGRVLGDLASLGYDAEWAVVRASAAGCCHRRERVFILAWDASIGGIDSRWWKSRDSEPRGETQARVSGRTDPGAGGAGGYWGRYDEAVKRWENVLGRRAPSPTEPGQSGLPRLSVRFASWMMGLPEGWICDVPGISRREGMELAGNGVVPQQAELALRVMLERMS